MKKSKVICFIGTDGSGKSTLIREVSDAYVNRGIRTKLVYFGWRPFLPTTKLFSYFFRKNGFKIVETSNKKKAKFSLLQETMLLYYFFEYLARYFVEILLSSKTMLVDRYFYDLYAHYDYAQTSRLFKYLMKLYPKPDCLFFLDAGVALAKQRKPEMDETLLEKHHKKYEELRKMIFAYKIDTSKNIKDCVDEIVNLISR